MLNSFYCSVVILILTAFYILSIPPESHVYINPNIEEMSDAIKKHEQPKVIKKEYDDTYELVDYIFSKESSRGRNNYSKCEEIGKYNRYGYGIHSGKYICFEKGDDTKMVKKWIEKRKLLGWTKIEMLCVYSGNNYSECADRK